MCVPGTSSLETAAALFSRPGSLFVAANTLRKTTPPSTPSGIVAPEFAESVNKNADSNPQLQQQSNSGGCGGGGGDDDDGGCVSPPWLENWINSWLNDQLMYNNEDKKSPSENEPSVRCVFFQSNFFHQIIHQI